MPCRTHGRAGEAGLCPICLLEQALASPRAASDEWVWPGEDLDASAIRRLTILMPLGETRAGAVYLVRQDAPVGALLRLKTWRHAAPAGFLDRFTRLQQQLTAAAEPSVVLPVAASVDAAGRPFVLSGFRQGVPAVQAARSGALAADAAVRLARSLGNVLGRLHTLGLPHGSVVPGNVMVQSGACFLIDFGSAGLLEPAPDVRQLIARDLEGVSVLASMLNVAPGPRSPL